MYRRDQEITDRIEMDRIIHTAMVCRLGLSDDGQPYVVPLNFGYDGSVVYMHSARQGRKLEIISRNPRVCLEFDGGIKQGQ